MNRDNKWEIIQIPVDNSMGFPYTYLLASDFNVR